MADLTKTVEIIFGAKSDVAKAVNDITRSLDSLSGGVREFTQPFADLSKTILSIDAAFNALVAGWLAVAVNAAGSFQSQFGEISTLIDITGEELAGFQKNIVEYSATSVRSIEEINGAVYAAISAGIDWSKSLEFVAEAEKLAVAGLAPLNDTTVALVSTMNAYGASADQAEKYSDILFTTVKQGQTTLPQLAGSLAQVTSIAAAGNVPFETVAAALATLTAQGMPTEQAVTALKGALTAIISPSAEAAKAAKALGLEFNADALATKGLDGVLADVNRTTGGSVEKISALFGNVRGLTGVLSLGSEGASRFQDNLEAMANSAGATAEAYGKVVDTFTNLNQKMANHFKAVLSTLGSEFLDEYTGVADGVVAVFQAIKDAVDAGYFDPIIDRIEAFGADMAESLQAIARNLPEAFSMVDWEPLVNSYENLGKSLKEAFEAVFGEIDVTTPEGLAAAIQEVANGITVLTNVTSGIVDGMKPFLETLGWAVDNTTNMDEATAKAIGTFGGFMTGLNTLAGIVGNLTPILGALGGVLSLNVLASLTTLAAAFPGVTAAVGTFASTVAPLAGPAGLLVLAAAGGYAVGKALDVLFPTVGKVADAVVDAADAVFHFSEVQGPTADEIDYVNKKYEEAKARHDAFIASQSAATEEVHGMILELAALGEKVDEVPDEKAVAVAVKLDKDSVDNTRNYIQYELPDGTWTTVYVDADTASLDEAQKEIDEKVPAEKAMQIELT